MSLKSLFTRTRQPQSMPAVSTPPALRVDQDMGDAENLVTELYWPASVAEILAAAHAAGFSEADYYAANPDLAHHFATPQRAALHFLAVARTERRQFPITLDIKGMTAIRAVPTENRDFIIGLLAALAFAATDMGDAPELVPLRKRWSFALELRDLGAIPYVIIGDSHSTLYRHAPLRDGKFLLPLNVCCSAGSAIGLGNPESRSGYGERLREIADFLDMVEDHLKLPVPILVLFGQVDLEFVHPFRRVKTGLTNFDPQEFENFVANSIASYIGFLKDIFPAGRRGHVTILGVLPPALADETLRNGYVNGHIASLEAMNDATLKAELAKLQFPSLPIRTHLHADYNARLETAGTESGFNFVADFASLLGPDGVLDQRFLASGKGSDHHIDRHPAEAPLTATIWSIVQPEETRSRIRFHDLTEIPNPALIPPLDRPDLNEAALTQDQLAWRRDGVLIKKSFIPDHILAPYIERRAAFRPGTAWNATGWPDGNCYEGIKQLRDVALYPPLMDLLRTIMGEAMLFHLALTGWVSTERDWHQDDYLNPDFINTWYAAVWIALDTIIPDSGPFQYIAGSHRWPLLRGEKVRSFLTPQERARTSRTTGINEWPTYAERFVTPAIVEKITESGIPVTSFMAEKGDILIWHSRLMHRGSRRTEGWDRIGDQVFAKYPRKSLITHYSGIDHRPDMIARETDANGHSFAVFGNQLILE